MATFEIRHGLPGRFGTIADLDDEPPVNWLIKGWLPMGELACIYGLGGTFKSYIAQGWSLQLAASSRHRRVVYIAAEGTSGLRSRVNAWMRTRLASGRDGADIPWHYYTAGVHLDDETSREMWVNELRGYLDDPPQLIVVDTLARNFGGDENSAKDVGMFVEGCEYLKRELDAAVLIVHHMGVKTGRERGTAALRNAMFAMYKVSDPRYNNRGGGSVILDCDRMKDAPIPDEVRVHFETVALDVDQYGEVHSLSNAMMTWPPTGKPRKKVITMEDD